MSDWKVKRHREEQHQMKMSVRLMVIIAAIFFALIYSTLFVRAQGCGNLPNCTDPRHYITTNSNDEAERQRLRREYEARRALHDLERRRNDANGNTGERK